MKALTIKRVEFFSIGDPEAYRFKWAKHIDDVYITTTICKITTEDGYVGIGGGIAYAEGAFDHTQIENGKFYVPGLLGKSALDREAIWAWMSERPVLVPLHAMSMIDVALWDLVGKYSNLPIYQLLGGGRDKILSYASSPYFETIEEYLTYTQECIDYGFKAIKVHPFADYSKDVGLIDALQENFGGKIGFMLDACGRYNRQEAFKMGVKLQDYDWIWYEEPISDRDYEGYKYLVQHLQIPISTSGNSQITLMEIMDGIKANAWTDIRADVVGSGGITLTRKFATLAEASGLNFELQAWGSTLAHAANLQLMLACDKCKYFEQAFPQEQFETGMKTVIRTDKDGYVHAPDGPGLGIEIDWEEVEKYTIKKYDSDEE